MMSDAERAERLLRLALTPVEPPERLTDRLERGLSELTDAAADELADWELAAMSDPRNWARPAAALVVGGVGRRRPRTRARPAAAAKASGHRLRALEKSARGVARDFQRRMRR